MFYADSQVALVLHWTESKSLESIKIITASERLQDFDSSYNKFCVGKRPFYVERTLNKLLSGKLRNKNYPQMTYITTNCKYSQGNYQCLSEFLQRKTGEMTKLAYFTYL